MNKHLEQVHADYCLDCGCPKDICCKEQGRKQGAVEAYKGIGVLIDSLSANGYSDKDILLKVIEHYEEELGVKKE